MASSIHRVVVRGQFQDLDAGHRAALLAELDDHEIFRATYTEQGSFTYDATLRWFNLRYEVRLREGRPNSSTDADPTDIALGRARTQFAEWGLEHKHLRATATDMAAMWDSADRSRSEAGS